MKPDYKQIYKNSGMLPRTLSEANRDADYATPLWRCETDTESGWRFLLESLIGLGLVALGGMFVAGLLYWLDLVK
jgi:hypothetical protein